MKDFMKPSIFWAMVSCACFLGLLAIFAGLVWQPFILFVFTGAAVAEWGAENHWGERLAVAMLYLRLGWAEDTMHKLSKQISEARHWNDTEHAQALQMLYYDTHKHWRYLRDGIVERRLKLDGSIVGVDYQL